MNASDTKERLTSGGFMGILSVLMQLRKVRNTPDHKASVAHVKQHLGALPHPQPAPIFI